MVPQHNCGSSLLSLAKESLSAVMFVRRTLPVLWQYDRESLPSFIIICLKLWSQVRCWSLCETLRLSWLTMGLSAFKTTLYFPEPVLCFSSKAYSRGKSPNMGRRIISYQEVLHPLLKNVNDKAHEAVLCNQSINGQLLRTSVLNGRLCFGALWSFCLSLNCDSSAVEGKLFFWISLVLDSLLSAILKPSFVS